jgi:hypothetical protein
MASVKARIKSAMEKFVAGMAILIGEDEATVSEALAAQISNTKVREGKDDETEPAPKRGRGRPPGSKNKAADDDDDEDEKPVKKGPKPPAKDEDDDEDEKPKSKKTAAADDDEDDDETPAIPSDVKLEAMERKALKTLAAAHDIEWEGKNREDLTKLLQEKRDGGKGKTKAKAKVEADDDDDEDEAPKAKAKSKKPAADDDDEDEAPKKKRAKAAEAEDEVEEPDEDDYPKVKIQKSDLEAFFKLNKQPLKDAGFFGGKPKKGVAPMEHTYAEIMGDVDLIKEAWKDNVWPEVSAGTWDKMKASAEDVDDEDDDE